MKATKTFVYPLGAVLVVAAFWGTMAMVQKQRHNDPGGSAAPPAASAQKSGEASSQGAGKLLEQGGVEQNASPAEDNRNWWGAKVRPRTVTLDEEEPPVQAAEVIELKPGSPAAIAGLRKGDAVVGVNREPLAGPVTLEDAVAAVPPGGKLSLQVLRAGEPVELTVVRGGTSSRGGLAQLGPAASPPTAAAGEAAQGPTGIYINGGEITPRQVQELRSIYGYVAPPGRYWYDARSGLYGAMGYEAAGFMRPGHEFGPLPANASNGHTGVFINGREINMTEAMYCQRLFGAVYQGRWWLDGRTGNLGAEGNPMPIANVFMALQQSQRSAQGGSYGWHSNVTGASGGSSGGCSYVSIPGSGTVMSGNCD
jgi:membrane-associated protease RseP (regulator of RpoE activity)